MAMLVEGRRLPISKRATTIGRSRECDIVVQDSNASRQHAEIRHIGLDYFIVDSNSTNGTVVNGQRIRRHALANGDRILIGTTELIVQHLVTETGLLIAEAAFLLLLFAFVWSIVRSSSRTLRDAEPVVVAPPAGPVHAGDTGSQAAIAPRMGRFAASRPSRSSRPKRARPASGRRDRFSSCRRTSHRC